MKSFLTSRSGVLCRSLLHGYPFCDSRAQAYAPVPWCSSSCYPLYQKGTMSDLLTPTYCCLKDFVLLPDGVGVYLDIKLVNNHIRLLLRGWHGRSKSNLVDARRQEAKLVCHFHDCKHCFCATKLMDRNVAKCSNNSLNQRIVIFDGGYSRLELICTKNPRNKIGPLLSNCTNREYRGQAFFLLNCAQLQCGSQSSIRLSFAKEKGPQNCRNGADCLYPICPFGLVEFRVQSSNYKRAAAGKNNQGVAYSTCFQIVDIYCHGEILT